MTLVLSLKLLSGLCMPEVASEVEAREGPEVWRLIGANNLVNAL